jgi:transcription termination factor Rho
MFEISQLKEKKLVDLQEIAKQLSIPKYRSLKKLDLVYQILDYQAANPKAAKEAAPATAPAKEKTTEQPVKKTRQRIQKPTHKDIKTDVKVQEDKAPAVSAKNDNVK